MIGVLMTVVPGDETYVNLFTSRQAAIEYVKGEICSHWEEIHWEEDIADEDNDDLEKTLDDAERSLNDDWSWVDPDGTWYQYDEKEYTA